MSIAAATAMAAEMQRDARTPCGPKKSVKRHHDDGGGHEGGGGGHDDD
jgi:hypothetical protein